MLYPGALMNMVLPGMKFPFILKLPNALVVVLVLSTVTFAEEIGSPVALSRTVP